MLEDKGPQAHTSTSQRQMLPHKPNDALDRAQPENLGAPIHERSSLETTVELSRLY